MGVFIMLLLATKGQYCQKLTSYTLKIDLICFLHM